MVHSRLYSSASFFFTYSPLEFSHRSDHHRFYRPLSVQPSSPTLRGFLLFWKLIALRVVRLSRDATHLQPGPRLLDGVFHHTRSTSGHSSASLSRIMDTLDSPAPAHTATDGPPAHGLHTTLLVHGKNYRFHKWRLLLTRGNLVCSPLPHAASSPLAPAPEPFSPFSSMSSRFDLVSCSPHLTEQITTADPSLFPLYLSPLNYQWPLVFSHDRCYSHPFCEAFNNPCMLIHTFGF